MSLPTPCTCLIKKRTEQRRKIMQKETFEFIDKAVSGDKEALQSILISVQDMVYNLSLRMLGNPHDAEDAVQKT